MSGAFACVLFSSQSMWRSLCVLLVNKSKQSQLASLSFQVLAGSDGSSLTISLVRLRLTLDNFFEAQPLHH